MRLVDAGTVHAQENPMVQANEDVVEGRRGGGRQRVEDLMAAVHAEHVLIAFVAEQLLEDALLHQEVVVLLFGGVD